MNILINKINNDNLKIMIENQDQIMKNEKSAIKEQEYEYTKKFTFVDTGLQHGQGIFYIKYVNDNYGKTHTISGTDLVRKFQQENFKIPPSLDYFVELVRKQDNPSPKELKCNNWRCNCEINKKYHIRYTGKGINYFINNQKTSAYEIVRTFNKENLPVPKCLQEYAESVRRQDNPTPEEIETNIINHEILLQKEANSKKEREELKNLINKTKASSRLEKLKAQNSITK